MPWWRQPFTIVFIPHDQSRSRSVSIRWITFLAFTLLGSAAFAAVMFFSLVGMKASTLQVQERMIQYRQKVAQLKQKNRSREQLRETIQSLRHQLEQTRSRHRAILKLTGFNKVLPDHGDADASGNQSMISASRMKSVLNRATQRNDHLNKVEQFVRSRNKVFRNTPMLWPTEGWMSSPYGYRRDPMGGKGTEFHEGVDIAAWQGTPVRAPANARVVHAGWKSGYGRTVIMRHKYGYSTLYGHLSRILVEDGQNVRKGAVVGRVGNTGHSTGSHVHYEVRINGKPVNPWPYLVERTESFQYAQK